MLPELLLVEEGLVEVLVELSKKWQGSASLDVSTAKSHLPDPPDELTVFPVAVLVGEEAPVLVPGPELMTVEVLLRQLESLPAWTVTISE